MQQALIPTSSAVKIWPGEAYGYNQQTVFPIGSGEGPHNTMGTTTAVIAFSTTPTKDLDHSCACLCY